MSPVDVSCMWFSGHKSFDCIVGDRAVDDIPQIYFKSGLEEVSIWGPATVIILDLYCYLTKTGVLKCLKNPSEVADAERTAKGEVKSRFGYTEDDLKPYIAYRGL